MIPKFSLLVTLALLLSVSPALIFAQSPSPSVRDAVKEKVQQELDQIKKAVAKRGFVGTITAKSDSTLTLKNLKDQSRTVTVPADTTIKLAGGKEGTFADLAVNNFILVMGEVDSQNAMTAKRLLVIKPSVPDTRQAILGTVTQITATTVTLENPVKEALTLKLTSTTSYTGKTKPSDIKTGAKIIVVARSSTALLIHLIPAPKQ